MRTFAVAQTEESLRVAFDRPRPCENAIWMSTARNGVVAGVLRPASAHSGPLFAAMLFLACEADSRLLSMRKKAHAPVNRIAFIVSAIPSTLNTRLRLYAST
jgi:hypothetical protein